MLMFAFLPVRGPDGYAHADAEAYSGVDVVVVVDVFGYPAYSHHDKFPPWWVFVREDYVGNLSGDKFPP